MHGELGSSSKVLLPAACTVCLWLDSWIILLTPDMLFIRHLQQVLPLRSRAAATAPGQPGLGLAEIEAVCLRLCAAAEAFPHSCAATSIKESTSSPISHGYRRCGAGHADRLHALRPMQARLQQPCLLLLHVHAVHPLKSCCVHARVLLHMAFIQVVMRAGSSTGGLPLALTTPSCSKAHLHHQARTSVVTPWACQLQAHMHSLQHPSTAHPLLQYPGSCPPACRMTTFHTRWARLLACCAQHNACGVQHSPLPQHICALRDLTPGPQPACPSGTM
jgi:hypothetical protein